jgi:hypothetical protein
VCGDEGSEHLETLMVLRMVADIFPKSCCFFCQKVFEIGRKLAQFDHLNNLFI